MCVDDLENLLILNMGIYLSTKSNFEAISFNSSSRSSQDRLTGPLPAKCWPDTFHETYIHNIQRKRENRIGWIRSLGTTISTTTPQLLQIKRWGQESKEEEP